MEAQITESFLVGAVFLVATVAGFVALAAIRRNDLPTALKDGIIVGVAGGIVVATGRAIWGV